MDPEWIKAAEQMARENAWGASPVRGPTAQIPRNLCGDEISVHRAMRESHPGVWLVWSAEGPFLLHRDWSNNRRPWEIRPDKALSWYHRPGYKRQLGWMTMARLDGARFPTRREAIQTLRAALQRFAHLQPDPQTGKPARAYNSAADAITAGSV